MLRIKYSIDQWNVDNCDNVDNVEDNWNYAAQNVRCSHHCWAEYGDMMKIWREKDLEYFGMLVMLQNVWRLLKKVCKISDIMLDTRTVRILITAMLITVGMSVEESLNVEQNRDVADHRVSAQFRHADLKREWQLWCWGQFRILNVIWIMLRITAGSCYIGVTVTTSFCLVSSV